MISCMSIYMASISVCILYIVLKTKVFSSYLTNGLNSYYGLIYEE